MLYIHIYTHIINKLLCITMNITTVYFIQNTSNLPPLHPPTHFVNGYP